MKVNWAYLLVSIYDNLVVYKPNRLQDYDFTYWFYKEKNSRQVASRNEWIFGFFLMSYRGPWNNVALTVDGSTQNWR